MKYSLKRRFCGRTFRYNYRTECVECVKGNTLIYEVMDLDRSDWKKRKTRKKAIERRNEIIEDYEFGLEFNVDLGGSVA